MTTKNKTLKNDSDLLGLDPLSEEEAAMVEATAGNLPKSKYSGNMVRVFLGVNRDQLLDVILTTDDGSWGQHLIIKLNDIPYATIPIVNREHIMSYQK